MNWTTGSDLKAQLRRLWERGELLRPLVTSETTFPLRLVLKTPNSNELTERFEAVRDWIAELIALPYIRIEWRNVQHRVHGLQRVPDSAWVDTLDAALAMLTKGRDAERFAQIVALTRATEPALIPWLAKRPFQALTLAGEWAHLIAIAHWLADHPRPGIYLRQVDLPGIHSKFVEAHRAVLGELLDLVLPKEAIAIERTGIGQFAARYGFLDKPVRIRFRVLDDQINVLPGPTRPDITLDGDSFAVLNIPIRRVFITENETNFLAFPSASKSIVIFGAGYGWDTLARADWLARCTIHYWGDIDTHGFAILNQLRRHFPHVTSFLMNRETLMNHRAHWGEEKDPVAHDLPYLTVEESALFDDLRDNRIQKYLRLEQERVGFEWVIQTVKELVEAPSHESKATSQA